MRKSQGRETIDTLDYMPEDFWPVVERALGVADREKAESVAAQGLNVSLRVDGEPAGYAAVRWTQMNYTDEVTAVVGALYLAPEFRTGRRGIRLIEAADTLAWSGEPNMVDWRCSERIGRYLLKKGYAVEYVVYRKTEDRAYGP